MNEPPDPWRRQPIGRRSTPYRFYIWLLLLFATVALVAFLAWRFPGAVDSDDDWAHVVYLVGLLALVSSSILVGRRLPLKDTIKQAAAWIAIALVLLVGYSYRFELRAVGERVLAELLPSRVQPLGERAISLRAGDDGHFRVEALVNDTPIRFLIDTGATNVVLSPRDARRLGFDLAKLKFTLFAETANGTVRGAPVRLDVVSLGELKLRDLPATVNEAEMATSLLGMRFLRQLRSYEVRDGALIMRW